MFIKHLKDCNYMEKVLEKSLKTKVEEIEQNLELDFVNGPAYPVSVKIKEQGFDIAGHGKVRTKYPLSSFIGILEDKEPIKKSFFGIPYSKHSKAEYLGTLWFNNSKKGANEYSRWVLNVNGRENLSKMTKLGKMLSKEYKIPVKLSLGTEYAVEENYILDLL